MVASVRSASQAGAATGNPVVTKPAGTADGDVLIAICFKDTDSAGGVTAPGGWTQVGSTTTQTGVSTCSVFRRVASGEGASYSFTGNANSSSLVAMLAITGADITTPVDVGPTFGGSGTNSASHVAPSVSPTGADSLLVCAANVLISGATPTTYTPPGGMTEQTDLTAGNWITETSASQELAASGATGTRTFTCSRSLPHQTVSIAIKSAGGAPPVPATLTGRPGRVALRSRPGAVLAVAVAALTGRPGRVVLRARAGTVVGTANATPAGRPAKLTFHAKAGTVAAADGPVSATLAGRPARLDLHARSGTVAATEGATSATLQGQPAHLELRSSPGAIATSAVSLSAREAGIWFRARPGAIEATSPGTSVTLAGRPSKILLLAKAGSIEAISPGISAGIAGRPARLTLHSQPGAVATVASAILPGRPARLALHTRPGVIAAVGVADAAMVGRPAHLTLHARPGQMPTTDTGVLRDLTYTAGPPRGAYGTAALYGTYRAGLATSTGG